MELYWLWLSLLPDIPLKKKLSLLARFDSPEALYRAEVGQHGLEETLWKNLQNKSLDRAIRISEECRRKRIGILTIHDPRYPRLLRNIQDPPLLLYWRGSLPDLQSFPTVGVVGTRHASDYGLRTARNMGAQLAAHGALVVSGMAEGIDGAATQGALDMGCAAVGVLGTGVDVIYPKCNTGLFARIEQQGCLLSEYPPGTRATKWTFPQRNRIISGLSDAVLVVEAPHRSGSLITARRAQEQGRQCFAVPGQVGEAGFEGSIELLRAGAHVASCGWDILEGLAPLYPGTLKKVLPPLPGFQEAQPPREPPKTPNRSKKAAPEPLPECAEKPEPPADMSPIEEALYRVLTQEPQDMDTLIYLSGLSAGEFMSALTMLQLRGFAQKHPGAMISFCNQQ